MAISRKWYKTRLQSAAYGTLMRTSRWMMTLPLFLSDRFMASIETRKPAPRRSIRMPPPGLQIYFWSLSAWPPELHSWSFHALVPLVPICIKVGSFVFKISYSQDTRSTHKWPGSKHACCLVLTLCGLALRSTRMTRPRVQRTSPWRNPSLWI